MINFLWIFLAGFLSAWAVIVVVNTREVVETVWSKVVVILLATILFSISGVLYSVGI
jgi:LPS O-antigen subunit length determinant protein (WzzB/FepE family)